jgi:hypothetical protein
MADTATASASTVDKAALRAELEATHAAYKGLVAQIGDDKWNAASGNSAFTCGQLAWHVASGVEFSTAIIENARKGKQTNLPKFMMPLAYKINERRIRSRSKAATRESVLADYAKEQEHLLRLLDEVPDADFSRSFTNYAQTKTVEEMFRTGVEHFAEHAPEIRASL